MLVSVRLLLAVLVLVYLLPLVEMVLGWCMIIAVRLLAVLLSVRLLVVLTLPHRRKTLLLWKM